MTAKRDQISRVFALLAATTVWPSSLAVAQDRAPVAPGAAAAMSRALTGDKKYAAELPARPAVRLVERPKKNVTPSTDQGSPDTPTAKTGSKTKKPVPRVAQRPVTKGPASARPVEPAARESSRVARPRDDAVAAAEPLCIRLPAGPAVAPNFVAIRGAVDENGKPILERPLGEQVAPAEPKSQPASVPHRGTATRPAVKRGARPAATRPVRTM
jgi:hypothetical protein